MTNPDERDFGRLEAQLEGHIESEELLLRNILDGQRAANECLGKIATTLATHGERSQNQHHRIKRSENIIMVGGGLFVTVFSGLLVALLTGAV